MIWKNLTPLLQLAVEVAEKYKDADHRCEKLGIQIREKEEKLKMHNVCYWLNGRKIEYIVRFNYIPRNGFKWNLVRYRNYLRLKVRLRELNTMSK